MKRLGEMFKAARRAKGLNLEELARLTGYTDVRKVAARIARFENDGTVKDELLSRLAAALDLEAETIEAMDDLDAQPTRPHGTIETTTSTEEDENAHSR